MSKVRDIARFLGKTEANNTNNDRLLIVGEGGLDSALAQPVINEVAGRIDYYTSLDSLPTSGLTANTRAFVESNQRYYISTTTGWYNVSLVNLSPSWDTQPNASYTITDSITPLTISATGTDSDNSDQNLLHLSSASDSAQYLVTITRDSSVYTFTPLSADSVHANVTAGLLSDSDGGDFVYTFKISDGINFVTQSSTITYTGLRPAQTPFRFRMYHLTNYSGFGNDALIMEFLKSQNDSDALDALISAMDSASDNSGSYTFTHQNFTKYAYLTFWDSAAGNGLTGSLRLNHNPSSPPFGAYTWTEADGPRIGTGNIATVRNGTVVADSSSAPSDTHYHHTDFVTSGDLKELGMTPVDWNFTSTSHSFNDSSIGGAYAQDGEDGHASSGTTVRSGPEMYFDTIRLYMEFDSSDVASYGQTDNLIWTARAMGYW